MADSVDRVFSHALNTVKKIPRTGSARPPAADRLKLYGLYKQSMEGNIEGIMSRPAGGSIESNAERDKWDAWKSQEGLSRTEAKRRYISTLIDAMHKYASQTSEAQDLVTELEFVWDQVKSNVPSASSGSPSNRTEFLESSAYIDQDGTRSLIREDMKDLKAIPNPQDAAEPVGNLRNATGEETGRRKWRQRVEKALIVMTVEIAALREHIEARPWQRTRRKGYGHWVLWISRKVLQHVLIDLALYYLIVWWMRRRKDDRIEVGGGALVSAIRDLLWARRARRTGMVS